MPALLALAIRSVPDGFQSSLEWTEKIYGNMTVTQSFISNKDNLLAIGASIKNPMLINKKNLMVTIMDERGSSKIITVNGQNIKDGNFIKFTFEPIALAANHKFDVTFSSPDSTSNEAFEVFITKNPKPTDQNLTVNGQKKEGAIATVSFHKPANLISHSLNIYSQLISKFLGDRIFTIAYLFLIMIFLGSYFIIFSKKLN
ncbi:MAG: hypothetical protein V1808_02755 [Candidatus Daviesbacteria bacterium]